jgi:hypothetical protein
LEFIIDIISLEDIPKDIYQGFVIYIEKYNEMVEIFDDNNTIIRPKN